MSELLKQLSHCDEFGKIDKVSPYPSDLKGQDGSDELTKRALEEGIKPGETKRTGKFIIGTVAGDLHDIGKNLVAMMIEVGGWEIIDLGVDVSTEKFLKAINENQGAVNYLNQL